MGRIFVVELEGRSYRCKFCNTHLALASDCVSQVLYSHSSPLVSFTCCSKNHQPLLFNYFLSFFMQFMFLESFFQCVSYRFMLPMFIKGVTLFAMIIKMVYFRSAYVIIIVFAYWLICQSYDVFQFVIFYARI